MKTAQTALNELWAEEFTNIKAYAYRVTQKIMAGQENPLFPSVDTLEEISADGITKAYAAAHGKQIGERCVLLAYVRNGCRNAIRDYRQSRRLPEYMLLSTTGNVEFSETIQAILSDLPEDCQQTAELYALGKNQTEIAETLGVSTTTIRRCEQRLRQTLAGV